MIKLYNDDALLFCKTQRANSYDLILVDPPYFKFKMKENWDRLWKTEDEYLGWLSEFATEWQRILKPNGSIYCFASHRMSAKVECTLGQKFKVLTRITWRKPRNCGKSQQISKKSLRTFFPASESIIFCEQFDQDTQSKGEHSDRFIFESIRKYLYDEMIKSGFTCQKVNRRWRQDGLGTKSGSGMAGHWFSQAQWSLPTSKNYRWLRSIFNETREGALAKEYEDLHKEYEDLHKEYEDLRRPFSVSSDVQFTDVWEFPTVKSYSGKHVCEKPADMLDHMIGCSTYPGSLVLDCFAGSGSTGWSCDRLGRDCVLVENDPIWCERMQERICVTSPSEVLL